MSLLSQQTNALKAAWGTYKLALNGGPRKHGWGSGTRSSQYELCWDAYTGSLYDPFRYASYKAQNNLYSKTRPIFSLVRSTVDFYAQHLYPGVIDDQGVANSASLDLAIPFVADDAQKLAFKQILQWSKFGATSNAWITYGAAVGDTVLSVVDDVEGGRVYLEARAPWHVPVLHLDGRGYIQKSTEEYEVYDPVQNQNYTFKREMTPESITTYKNGVALSFDTHFENGAATVENPYGFVPLSYSQHNWSPGIPGTPAFQGWTTLDELNSLGSRLNDYVRTQSDTPMMFIGGGKVEAVKIDGAAQQVDERGIRLLQMGSDGKVEKLEGNLELAAVGETIDRLHAHLKEVNNEITTYQQLRSLTGGVSGVAARLLLGDVESKLSGAAGNYDSGLILALRQAVAIAGMRQKEGAGGWAKRTEQQRAFVPFGMDSYQKGDLNFGIAPRPLVPDTLLDKAQTDATYYGAVQAAENLGIPALWKMQRDGVLTADDVKDIERAQGQRVGDGFADPTKEMADAA